MSASVCFTAYRNRRDVLLFRLLVATSCSHACRQWNCHFLQCSSVHNHALCSICVCLSVRVVLTYTLSQVFSCTVRKIVHCKKRDKCNSLREVVSRSAPCSKKAREKQKQKTRQGDPSSSGMGEHRERISLAEARWGKWRECMLVLTLASWKHGFAALKYFYLCY